MEDERESRIIEECLSSHGVHVRVVHVSHGPEEKRFGIEPAPSIRISLIEKLSRELAYYIGCASISLQAPIPGRSLIGIFVPKNPEIVCLRNILESVAMQKSKSILAVALGEDRAGTPIVCVISRKCHIF